MKREENDRMNMSTHKKNLTKTNTTQSAMRPTAIACLGASITAAKGSFDWIGELEKRPQNQQFRFSNLGVGGDLAYSALQRLPSVVACHPGKVVIILGHNDIMALVFKKVRHIFGRWKHLPSDPSPEWYRQNLQTIVRRLKEETSAKIALASLSQIGEDPESINPVQRELNLRFQQYSKIIKEVAQEENVSYIPFYERFHEQIVASPGRAFTTFNFLPFYRDVFRQFVLHKSHDEIGHLNGWHFHRDGIHLNSRSGKLLADLVQEFISTGTGVDDPM